MSIGMNNKPIRAKRRDSIMGKSALSLVTILVAVAIRAEGERFKIADTDDVYQFSVGATFTF
jgi:hypothetical protein